MQYTNDVFGQAMFESDILTDMFEDDECYEEDIGCFDLLDTEDWNE